MVANVLHTVRQVAARGVDWILVFQSLFGFFPQPLWHIERGRVEVYGRHMYAVFSTRHGLGMKRLGVRSLVFLGTQHASSSFVVLSCVMCFNVVCVQTRCPQHDLVFVTQQKAVSWLDVLPIGGLVRHPQTNCAPYCNFVVVE